MEKKSPQKIWIEYEKLRDYLNQYNVYDQVKINEKFYEGNQWDGVDAPDIAKPVMNELARIGNYQIAALSSKGVGVSIMPFHSEDKEVADAISKSTEDVIEQAKMEENSRQAIRDGFVDGCSYAFQNFNENEKAKGYEGIIEEEMLDITQVYFGNPFSNKIQSQPYIILAFRQYIEQVKQEAKERGLNQDAIDSIMPDNDSHLLHDETNDKLCTVLLKLWKEEKPLIKKDESMDEYGNIIIQEIETDETIKTVHFSKSTKSVFLVDDIDLDYKRYPIARFGWSKKKNSFLYDSPVSANITNQIFINKCFAYADEYLLKGAFPKIAFDSTKVHYEDLIKEGMGSLNLASLDILGKFLDFTKAPELPVQLNNFITLSIQEMRTTSGINDAALGDVKPDNTSAIIALQESANAPLELQRQEFYEFWEDRVRNIIDIMSVRFGQRVITIEEQPFLMDYDKIQDINYDLKIDIGSGSQYSELAQITTLDNLLGRGLIQLEDYLEAIPDKLLPKKNVLLKRAKERQQAMMMAQQPVINQ